MKTKTQNLIETLTSNVKKNDHVETMAKVNAGLIKNRTTAYLGKPKDQKISKKPMAAKRDKYHVKSNNPNKIEL